MPRSIRASLAGYRAKSDKARLIATVEFVLAYLPEGADRLAQVNQWEARAHHREDGEALRALTLWRLKHQQQDRPNQD